MSTDSFARNRDDIEITTVADNFSARGWTVAHTANGLMLISDTMVAGIEVRGAQAADVRRYLDANHLSGPVIAIPGPERREIHLVTGIPKATLALAALPAMGAILHTDGAAIPLPPTKLMHSPATHWAIAPHETRGLPPVVALSAALRAVRRASTPATQSA